MQIARRRFLRLSAAATFATACGSVRAEIYPAHPIRILVTSGPGSAVDILPRVIFEQISAEIGETAVIDNRLGAGGAIATAAAAKAEPDGYTLLVASSSLTVAPWIYAKLPYDVAQDFAAIVPLGAMPLVLVVSPEKGFRTAQDFVAAAKAKPGAFNYTSNGIGSATHMSAERFRMSAGIEAVHVPMKGANETIPEILSGRVDFYLCPLAVALPYISEKKLLALTVSGAQRAAVLPDVPTTSEAGFSDADYTYWIGLFAPAKTPRPIIAFLHDETTKALQTESLRQRLATLGVTPMPLSPEDFDALVKRELTANAALVRAAGISPH